MYFENILLKFKIRFLVPADNLEDRENNNLNDARAEEETESMKLIDISYKNLINSLCFYQ